MCFLMLNYAVLCSARGEVNFLEEMLKRLEKILNAYHGDKGTLIPILQEIQGEFGYLPEELFSEVARFSGISQNEIYGVATFYTQFRFTPPAEHTVKVCLGTACHVRGGADILDAVERELSIQQGGITSDRKFGLERVACFGCCALAPVMVVDDNVYAKMTGTKAKQILMEYGWKDKKA